MPSYMMKTHHFTDDSKAGSSVDKMNKEIPRTYLGVTMSVYKMIIAWVARKTKDITLFIRFSAVNWTNSEVVFDCGIFNLQWEIKKPLPSIFVINRSGYYTLSVADEA